jgi:hypothetical protein
VGCGAISESPPPIIQNYAYISGGHDVPSVAPVWVFLVRRLFAAKTPDYEGWISLDFLGFSRSNQDFSMGYADKARRIFPRAFVVAKEPSETVSPRFGMRKGQTAHGGKFNLISDFLQEIDASEIDASAVPFCSPPSKSNSLKQP